MSLKDKIAAAKAALGSVEPVEQDVVVGNELVKLAFLPADGQVWADLVSTHPPRVGSKNDSDFGFNVDAVGRHYPHELITADGEPVTAEEWAELFVVLASPHIKNIGIAVWGKNQLEPARKLIELGKASAGASKKKSSSPAN
tara:strand:+ start:1230 stop:1655 length:426 start_codon:yes stop_codon:yes gene_type:complete